MVSHIFVWTAIGEEVVAGHYETWRLFFVLEHHIHVFVCVLFDFEDWGWSTSRAGVWRWIFAFTAIRKNVSRKMLVFFINTKRLICISAFASFHLYFSTRLETSSTRSPISSVVLLQKILINDVDKTMVVHLCLSVMPTCFTGATLATAKSVCGLKFKRSLLV